MRPEQTLHEANSNGNPYATPEYADLMQEAATGLQHHRIGYVPFTPEQEIGEASHLHYVDQTELADRLHSADAVVCISRDEDLNPDYSDAKPEHNIVLTPSGNANVEKSVEMFNAAKAAGNHGIKFMATGRMHNRAVRAMLALPVVAEFIGVNGEDVNHIPQYRFRQLLDAAFTPDNIGKLQLDIQDEEAGASYKALATLLNDEKYGTSVPTPDSSPEDIKKAADAIYQEFLNYPRMSTSRLMVERAVELGVPLEDIYEEDGAVDTISNIIFTRQAFEAIGEEEGRHIRKVVIVAGSDHLPRTATIADHVFTDDMEITCVESDPALTPEAYEASCQRELASYRRGSKWIAPTRDIGELEKIVEIGYFSRDREDAAETAAHVAAHVANTISANKELL